MSSQFFVHIWHAGHLTTYGFNFIPPVLPEMFAILVWKQPNLSTSNLTTVMRSRFANISEFQISALLKPFSFSWEKIYVAAWIDNPWEYKTNQWYWCWLMNLIFCQNAPTTAPILLHLMESYWQNHNIVYSYPRKYFREPG